MREIFGVVILNYLNYTDTIACVDSIRKQSLQPKRIVIVDNASPNESHTKLVERFMGDADVDVLQTDKNLGYARGNNVGIAHLKQQGIINAFISNPDVTFADPDYFSKLCALETPENVAMIGTRIVDEHGSDQSPYPVAVVASRSTGKKLMTFLKDLAKYMLAVMRIMPPVKRGASGASSPQQEEAFPHMENVVLNPAEHMLHGAAIFFVGDYLKRFDGYYKGTFLYGEEDALALICQREGFRQLYAGTLELVHAGTSSTDMAWKKKAVKRKSLYWREGRMKVDWLALLPLKSFERKY
ncbi:glycosyl transferase [Bifidobacterium pseudolongum subsp. globosum]|uniref:glycosyltransferase n=1 Tax=Bifidobacterium pseudolongum TaxID=1694 RepID=UPI0010D06969|nr:glycosyltransferase family 2 protein [Bifidobacterium pseudolongum]RYQ58402.1 glycosyl transferase [Bifidobacterium pseudolongum subsp. globosum]